MIVVFDTNAYRDFVKGRSIENIKQNITAIQSKEKDKGITAYLHTTVAMELLCNLSDTNGKLLDSCLKAATAMYLHCGDQTEYRLLPLHEVQLINEYFGIEDTNGISTQKSIGHILYCISKSPTTDTINVHTDHLKRIKLFIDNAEENLAKEFEAVIKEIDPSATDWHLFKNDKTKRMQYLKFIRSCEFEDQTSLAMLSAIYIYSQSQQYNISHIKTDNISNMVHMYKVSHRIPLDFRRKYFEFLTGSNFDFRKKSRANFIWDEKILSIVGRSINKEHIMLVTSDNLMYNTAKKIDPNCCVMKFNEYMQYLGL